MDLVGKEGRGTDGDGGDNKNGAVAPWAVYLSRRARFRSRNGGSIYLKNGWVKTFSVEGFMVETYATETDSRRDCAKLLAKEFDLTPQGIIDTLDLLRPIYYPTATYGHFGRDDLELPWEMVVNA